MEDRKEQLQNTSNRSTEIFPINQIVTFLQKSHNAMYILEI